MGSKVFTVEIMLVTSRNENTPPLSPDLPLATACLAYLKRRRQYLRPRSFEAYQYHFNTLQGFFAPNTPLSSFHEDHFRQYQVWRTSSGTGSSLINHELSALSQILALADLWHPISKYYERLPEKNWDPPKVMTTEEEDRFFRFATRKQEWKTAYNAARLTSNSTISGCELRTLRLENIALLHDPPVIYLPVTVKNRHRVRAVPLNSIAVIAVQELLGLAQERGSNVSHHYLIPFRIQKGLYDPNRPGSPCFIRRAFRAIARASGLDWVTPTTFRHQAITKLLESGSPDETVRAIAGHVSEKALNYYSHIRIAAKKQAVDRLVQETRGSVKKKPARFARSGDFPFLTQLKESAKRLRISPDAALELVLEYERNKSTKNNMG